MVTVPCPEPKASEGGELSVTLVEADSDVFGIGDLTIRLQRDRVGSVHAATRIGDASLRGVTRVEGRRRMLIGARVDWVDGPGPVDIAVGLKIGNASVVLE